MKWRTTVKETLGQRETEMTLRYSHLAPAHKAKAVEKLGEALNAAFHAVRGPRKRRKNRAFRRESGANQERFRC
jgi:hypothetical protein